MRGTRYCGNVKINCSDISARYTATSRDEYHCYFFLKWKRKWKKLGMIRVGVPAYLANAVDSPQAYDDAAHAAISFAVDEEERGEKDWGISNHLDMNDSGWRIRRRE